MAWLRWVKEAEEDFTKARQMTDVAAAIRLMGKWVGLPIREEEERIPGNWVPWGIWDGRVWLKEDCYNIPYILRSDPLYAPLVQAIPPHKIVKVDEFEVGHMPENEKKVGNFSAFILIARGSL